jgi:hypothetical protein
MASVTSSLVWKRVGPAVVMASASTTWRSYGSETKCEEAPKKKQTPEEFREGHKRAMEMMESMYKTHDCGKQIKEYHQCIYDECVSFVCLCNYFIYRVVFLGLVL